MMDWANDSVCPHRERTRASWTPAISVALPILFACGWMLGCGGGSGQKTPPPPTTAPSNLHYSAMSISATANQAITNDVPSVTGTVTAYAVSPSLPAGLSISSTSGVISGTPTVITAQNQYRVTASNIVGSTSATIVIQVTGAVTAPGALMYSSTSITAVAGFPIVPDLPATSGGAITSYTVTPALPPGLTLNSSTGVISGTPTAGAEAATYVVDGANSAGTVTAAVSPTIAVSAAPTTILQLGNQYGVTSLQFSNGRVLSQDTNGFWILWNYATGAEIASGAPQQGGQTVSGFSTATSLAGPTLAIGIPGGVELRSSADGHIIETIISPGFGSTTTHCKSRTAGNWLSMAATSPLKRREEFLFTQPPGNCSSRAKVTTRATRECSRKRARLRS